MPDLEIDSSSEHAMPNSGAESVHLYKNPYHLHPDDNPRAILVTPPLDGTNYYRWRRSMQRALLSKNKLKFVDGSISAPSFADAKCVSWIRCNAMVVSWIIRTLSSSIAKSVVHTINAADLWNELKERFTKSNFRVSDILREIHTINQGESSVTTFYNDLKELWDEFDQLRPNPNCICTSTCACSIYITNGLKKHQETEQVISFLNGLNAKFSYAKTQILMVDPLPPLSSVLESLLQHECQIESNASILGDSELEFQRNLTH